MSYINRIILSFCLLNCCHILCVAQLKESITVTLNFDDMMQPKVPAYLRKNDKSLKQYSMIIYVDEYDCPICFINELYEWEILMKSCKEAKVPIRFIFIFSPLNTEFSVFLKKLSSSSISDLSYVDVGGKFKEMNPWITNEHYSHFFIVDKNMVPIFVDNPQYSKDFLEQLKNL